MRYDFLVFIGRFQPFHNGHKAVVDKALAMSEKVIMLVGSADRARSPRNPFNYAERVNMITAVYGKEAGRIIFAPLDDFMYNDTAWVAQVNDTVREIVLREKNIGSPYVHLHGYGDAKVGLIGCKKDETSYYLNLFPDLLNEGVAPVDPEQMLGATEIREKLYALKGLDVPTSLEKDLPDVVMDALGQDHLLSVISTMSQEQDWLDKYKQTVQKYPRIEHTVDAVVIQSGHVLLITRDAKPGEGMLAMPGGFLNPSERLEDGMIRELREETKLKVPDPVLRGNIKATHTYDDPHRSGRGRIITNAYLIKLPDGQLPKVKGSDDARSAHWVKLNELRADMLFEDHFFIVQDLIRRSGI